MMETYALYQRGFSIEDMARQRNCTARTIENHLADCVRARLAINLSQFVSVSERAQIEKAIEQQGTDKLRPIRDALPESITYFMIRLVLADLQQAEEAKQG